MELIDRAKVERITFQEPSYSDPINVLTEVRDKVRALPTVDAEPVRHGKWTRENNYGIWKCNVCGCKVNRSNPLKGNIWNYYYCPNCGAKMDAEMIEPLNAEISAMKIIGCVGRKEREMKEYIVTEHPDFPYEEPKPQELIRCKDCKYWQFYDAVKANVCKRRYDRHYWQSHEDDFCSRAERKEE